MLRESSLQGLVAPHHLQRLIVADRATAKQSGPCLGRSVLLATALERPVTKERSRLCIAVELVTEQGVSRIEILGCSRFAGKSCICLQIVLMTGIGLLGGNFGVQEKVLSHFFDTAAEEGAAGVPRRGLVAHQLVRGVGGGLAVVSL